MNEKQDHRYCERLSARIDSHPQVGRPIFSLQPHKFHGIGPNLFQNPRSAFFPSPPGPTAASWVLSSPAHKSKLLSGIPWEMHEFHQRLTPDKSMDKMQIMSCLESGRRGPTGVGSRYFRSTALQFGHPWIYSNSNNFVRTSLFWWPSFSTKLKTKKRRRMENI